METFDHILIFKTNIKTEADRLCVKKILDAHNQIEKWNVDTEDIDCVLRVVSYHLRHADIIRLISGCNYQCAELEDLKESAEK